MQNSELELERKAMTALSQLSEEELETVKAWLATELGHPEEVTRHLVPVNFGDAFDAHIRDRRRRMRAAANIRSTLIGITNLEYSKFSRLKGRFANLIGEVTKQLAEFELDQESDDEDS